MPPHSAEWFQRNSPSRERLLENSLAYVRLVFIFRHFWTLRKVFLTSLIKLFPLLQNLSLSPSPYYFPSVSLSRPPSLPPSSCLFSPLPSLPSLPLPPPFPLYPLPPHFLTSPLSPHLPPLSSPPFPFLPLLFTPLIKSIISISEEYHSPSLPSPFSPFSLSPSHPSSLHLPVPLLAAPLFHSQLGTMKSYLWFMSLLDL